MCMCIYIYMYTYICIYIYIGRGYFEPTLFLGFLDSMSKDLEQILIKSFPFPSKIRTPK